MLATHSAPSAGRKHAVAKAAKPCRPNDYCVPPILVNDLTSQCAAHFLAQFVSNSTEHVRDVLKRGIHRPGGLVEEVQYWMGECAPDAAGIPNGSGYWDHEENGPWVYGTLAPVDVARVVSRHTRGWSLMDFGSYGYTVSEKAELDATVSKLK